MLHLDPGVDLDEIEIVLLVDDELDRTRGKIVGRLRQPHRGVGHLLPRGLRETRRRALLDQLLVPPLRGAVALPEVEHVAVLVAQDLDFDVPRPLDVFFDVDARVAEGGLGFGRCLLPGARQREVVGRHPHPLAAAAGRRLEQHRKADLAGDLHRLLFAADDAVAARHRRHARFPGQRPGRILVAHPLHRFGCRADEADIARAADLGEVGVFREKAVAGMDRLHVADLGGADHPVDAEVAVGGAGRAHADGLVGQLEIGRSAVGLAEDGDGLDAELAAGTNHPQRDLAAVGDQDPFEHG